MTAEPVQMVPDHAAARRIRIAAKTVARELETRQVRKPYGVYHIYEDALLTVESDTYGSNLQITLADGRLVFATGGGDYATTFRPGRWVAYLEQLSARACTAMGERTRHERTALAVVQARCYGPVDDDDLFDLQLADAAADAARDAAEEAS